MNGQTARDAYLSLLNLMREEAGGLEVSSKSISVQANGHTLTEEDLKINDNLRASWMEDEEMDIAMEDGLVLSGQLSGKIPGCGYGGGHSSFSVTGISGGKLRQEKARVKTPWRLAAGDTVLLIPDRERQFFYLVMKVVDYGAVPLNRAPRPAR